MRSTSDCPAELCACRHQRTPLPVLPGGAAPPSAGRPDSGTGAGTWEGPGAHHQCQPGAGPPTAATHEWA
eukprot:1101444-Alexandrium_andersonii.AAC.1